MSPNKVRGNPNKRGLRIFRFKEQEIVIGKNKTEKSKNKLCYILQPTSILKKCI